MPKKTARAKSKRAPRVTTRLGIDSASFQTQQQAVNNHENAVFVSYAWEGESERAVEELERAFAKRGIRIVRDKKDLGYKGSIEAFEQRIGRGQCVILVISNKYLRSEHCMWELLEVDKNRDLRERIFPVVLADARIYKAADRLSYIHYWDEQIAQLNQALKQVDVMANVAGSAADLDKYWHIRANFDHLTDLLADINALTPEIHAASGFSTLISSVECAMAGKQTVSQTSKGTTQHNEISENRSAQIPMCPKIVRATSTSRKVLVMVHGAGTFPNDWHKPLVATIEKELGHSFAYLPVYYADVTNRQSVRALETPGQLRFKKDFQNEPRKSFDAARASPTIPSDRAVSIVGLPAPLEQFAGITQELADYFFNASVRAEIQARLTTVLDQAKRKSQKIVLVCRSLGTVVCFDVLKQSANRYRIPIWFTTGAPIAKLRRIGMYDDNLGAITAQNVAHWYNVYNTTDWIADPLGPVFPKPGYRVDDIFVNVASDPVAWHDYFNNRETIQMFADALR